MKNLCKYLFVTTILAIIFSFSAIIPYRHAEANQVIPVGNEPLVSALSGNTLYVANLLSNTVTAVDTTTNAALATITVGSNPIQLNPVGTSLYVLNNASGSVSVIDMNTNTVTATVSVGTCPNGAALVGTNLYVTNSCSNSISVIDTNTNTVSATIGAGANTSPWFPIVVGTNLYVLNAQGNSVSVVDTNSNTVTSVISVGTSPSWGSLIGTNLYVLNQNSNNVSVIDTLTNTVTTTVSVDSTPWSAVVVGTNLYVNNSGSNTVSVIDTNTNLVSNITVGSNPYYSVVAGANPYVYVENGGSNTVSVIDTKTNTIAATLAGGNGPYFSVLKGTKLYIIDVYASGVYVIDTTTNTVIPVPPPQFLSAAVNGATLSISYDEALDSTSVPPAGDFTVQVNGKPIAVSSVAVSGKSVVLTLSAPVITGDVVTVNYGEKNHPFVKDLVGESPASGTDQPVTNNTPVPAPAAPVPTVSLAGGMISGGGSSVTWTPQTGFLHHDQKIVTGSVPQVSLLFTKDLKKGMADPEIVQLQKYLGSHGFVVVSVGKETSLFGSRTAKELKLFQKSVGLKADGSFGPATRAYINAHQ